MSQRLEEVWVMALRAMDDIKESVRTAAAKLVRTLRGLTLRLCDPAHSLKVQLPTSIRESSRLGRQNNRLFSVFQDSVDGTLQMNLSM